MYLLHTQTKYKLDLYMLGQLEISDLTAAFLALVALVFIGSFAVVSLQTGELIKPPKND